MVRTILGLNGPAVKPSVHLEGDAVAVAREPAICAYLAALSTIQGHPVRLDQTAAEAFSAGVGKIRIAAETDCSPEALEEQTKELARVLEAYARKADDWLERRTSDFKILLTALAESSQALLGNTDGQATRLRSITDKLQTIAQTRKPTGIDGELSRCVQELRATVVAVERENRRAIARMSEQLTHFQRRLETTERLAATDELTGLLNRRDGTKEIQKRIQSGKKFCVVALDLNRFKQINDTYGHLCGDEVLRMFARRLAAVVRSTDTTIRWGGDEFLVIADCPLDVTMRRAQQLVDSVGRTYRVIVQEKPISLSVQASFGVAECQVGESLASIIARADAALYAMKRTERSADERENSSSNGSPAPGPAS